MTSAEFRNEREKPVKEVLIPLKESKGFREMASMLDKVSVHIGEIYIEES
jgi:hypothetical protein